MTERLGLLPPNATPLEHSVSETLDRLPELGFGAANVHNFKFAEIPSVVPHLIVEYGLGEVAAYLPNPNEAIARGIPWQRLRGTPAALTEGFSWIGQAITVHEEPNWTNYWWWFQVEFDNPIGEDLLPAAAALGDISSPLRSRFARGFWLYDMRAFRTSEAELSGFFLVGDWSGKPHLGLDPVWSFGREVGSIVSAGPSDFGGVWEDEVWNAGTWLDDADLEGVATIFGNPAITAALARTVATVAAVDLDLAALKDKVLLFGYGPGDAAWDGVQPAMPDVDDRTYVQAAPYGYRRIKPAFFVEPGQAPHQSGEPWNSYKPAAPPTDRLLIEAETDFCQFDDQLVREIVLYVDPVFAGSPPAGQRSFTAAELTDPGTPLLIIRIPKVMFSEVIRERTFVVFDK